MKLQWWKRSCSVLLAAAMGYFSIGMPVQAEEVPILEEQPEQLESEATEAIEIEADAVEDPNVDVTEGSLRIHGERKICIDFLCEESKRNAD